MTQKWKGLCRTVAVPWEYTLGCKPIYWIWFAHMSEFRLAKVVLCLHCTITPPMICILPMDTPPSDSKTTISHYNLTFTGLKIQKLPEWACIVHFSGYIQVIFIQMMGCQLLTVSVQAHMMLPLSIFDHINNDKIWELVKAHWNKHRMEDNIIDGTIHGSNVEEQLLRQQLAGAELEVNLLHQCFPHNSRASSNNTGM